MRMHPLRPLVLLALVLTPAAVAAEKKAEVDRVLSAAREDSKAMDHLDHLSNRIGPRLTGSASLQVACEWARDRFASFGIEDARIEKWGEFPVGFDRGPWSGRVVEPVSKPLDFGTYSWTAGTKGIVRGPAIMAPANDDELAKTRDKLPGAWVLTPLAPTPPGGQGRGQERPDSPAAVFRRKLDAAYAEAKVAGVVRSTRNDLILTGGSYQVEWDKLPTIPSINLAKGQFDELAAMAKEGKPVVLEFDIRNHFTKGPIPLFNVIADIPGIEFPDEYVIVGGHIDTWDGATGTTDNGTGCATTLEAARILMKSGVRPRRTIRFMLWSGEEQGLLGSKAYVASHPEILKRISAVLVHDGGTNYLSGIGATKAQRKDMDEAMASVVGLDPAMPFQVRDVSGLRGGGSDHASFLAAGVPGFFWRQSGKANYTTTHHTQHDTYDRAVPEYQKHSSLVAALGALGIADLDHLLSREAMIAPGGLDGGGGRRTGMQVDDSLKITEVGEGSIAEKAGLKPGDVVAKVAGKAVADREALMDAVREGGAEVTIIIKRDGQEIEQKLAFPATQP